MITLSAISAVLALAVVLCFMAIAPIEADDR